MNNYDDGSGADPHKLVQTFELLAEIAQKQQARHEDTQENVRLIMERIRRLESDPDPDGNNTLMRRVSAVESGTRDRAVALEHARSAIASLEKLTSGHGRRLKALENEAGREEDKGRWINSVKRGYDQALGSHNDRLIALERHAHTTNEKQADIIERLEALESGLKALSGRQTRIYAAENVISAHNERLIALERQAKADDDPGSARDAITEANGDRYGALMPAARQQAIDRQINNAYLNNDPQTLSRMAIDATRAAFFMLGRAAGERRDGILDDIHAAYEDNDMGALRKMALVATRAAFFIKGA